MSHKVTLSLSIKDKACLKRACNALKITFQEGSHTVRQFTTYTPTEFSVQLPGWNYPVAINLQSGEVVFDNYNGSWGDIKQLHRLAQEYALQVAESEASVQDLLMRGYVATRVSHANGQIDLVIEKE